MSKKRASLAANERSRSVWGKFALSVGTVENGPTLQLRFEQLVSVPRKPLFEFHMDPANMAILMEGWHGFELRKHPGSIQPGSRLHVRQKVGPLTFKLEFVHFLLEPPERFGERVVGGPFKRFEHIHEFHEDPAGTRIADRIDCALPWYLGGPVADRVIVKRELARFFEFRRKAYARLLENGVFS